MTIKRCEACSGRKTVTGIGSMIIKCKDCNGVGHFKVEDKSETIIDNSNDKVESIPIDKRFKMHKKGRL